MTSLTLFRQSIADYLVLIVMVVAGPLVALQFFTAFAKPASARQEALKQSSQAGQVMFCRIGMHEGHVNSLLTTFAATVPLQRRTRRVIKQGNATFKLKASLSCFCPRDCQHSMK
jgi:hypothetical protein